ncbi:MULTISPECIES: hypothetical protein [unclassified Carboxylicivirga]|uniref:hypothetical protein n=1 Tax=Carboxylicivirga TaxID=1628153 RepID=UPI003D32FEFE
MAVLPEVGITTTMVRNALGASSNKVTDLCSSSNINRYSKRKPIRYESSNPDKWYSGNDNWYSLYVPGYNGTDTQEWSYRKPLGGVDSPYRMGHFRGYYHGAEYPVVVPYASIGQAINRNGHEFVAFAPITSDTQVTIADLGLGLGVEIRDAADDSLINWASAPVGEASVNINLENYVNLNEVNVRFFLADGAKLFEGANTGVSRYSLPRGSKTNEIPLTVNSFWNNIPVTGGDQDSPYLETFTVYQTAPGEDRVRINVKPRGYYGTLNVVIRENNANQVKVGDFDLNIINGNTAYEFVRDLSASHHFQPDLSYKAAATWKNVAGVDPNLQVGYFEFFPFALNPLFI